MNDHVVCAVEPTDERHLVWDVAHRVANSMDSRVHVINAVEPMTHYYANLDFAPLVECTADWHSATLSTAYS
jgi:hypothetical protein